jgi:signal transduction histidine kinase/ligand-binding sensor domain-containing protein
LKISSSFPLCVLCFMSATTWAVDPRNHISQYGHTVWKTVDGVVVGPEKITQTTDGYIWIATNSGLLRFDGIKFSGWSPPAGQSLPSQGISALHGARDGSLWIGTYSGLSRFKDGNLSNYPTDSNSGVSEILEDHFGVIWIARYDLPLGNPSLCRLVSAKWSCYGKNEGNPAYLSLGLAEDNSGGIWYGCHMICRMKAGSFSYFMKEQLVHPAGEGVIAIAAKPSDSVWVSLDGVGPKLGVRHLVDNEFVSYVVPGFDGATVRAHVLFVDRHQTLWIGSDSQGLYRIRDGVADHYGHVDGLSGDFVHSVYEDQEGDLWVATDKGMDLFRDTPVVSFTSSEGLVGTKVASVLASSNGSVWVGTEGALNEIRAGTVSAIAAAQGLPGQDVSALYRDTLGRLWLGLDDTITTYKDGRFTDIHRADGSRLGVVGIARSFAADNEGNIWALTSLEPRRQASLLRFKDNRLEETINAPGIPEGAKYLATNRNGGIWIGTLEGKLAHYTRNDTRLDLLIDADFSAGTRSLFVDSDNSVWAATNKGLYRWKDGHLSVMDARNGLPCASVFAVIDDNEKSLWLYARCGLLKILATDLANWVRDPESHVALTMFDHTDGVFPAYPDGNTQPSTTRSSDGRLWFNGQFVQVIDPRRTYTNAVVPEVHVEEVIADEKNYPLGTAIKLPALTRNIEIRYTALSFVLPQKVQFRYRLEGRDPEWQEAGTRRQAFYTSLPPGDYRFRVRASNNSGMWNEQGAVLDFWISPAYWQTNWFRALCSVAFLLLLWLVYWLRLRRMTRTFNVTLEARVNERTRIARELHDTLLQSLHGLLFQFQAVRNLLPRRPDEAIRSLDHAINDTESALAESRDAIRGLRSEPIAKGDLAELLMAASRELAKFGTADQQPPVFELIEEGEKRPLSVTARNEIYRVALEVLRNAYRHAHATRIEVEIRYDDRVLRIRIRDNGRGVDSTVLKNGAAAGHWGLQGVRERAERIGARLDFWSEVGAGTEVQLTVPAHVAYQTPPDDVSSGLLRKVRNRAGHS